MVIVDEKCMQPIVPPPPYAASSIPAPPPPFPHLPRHVARLTELPQHLLLKIVHMTLPQTPGRDEGRIERQRKTLYWFSVNLRLVNRAFYIACMHVLRSTYLPAYDTLIHPPYTSDPFPLSPSSPSYSFSTSPTSSAAPSPIDTIQRETQVLDMFIALKVREDVMMDDSELHLEREESFKDLFDLMQPRARMEDLVRYYGLRENVVCVGPPPSVAKGKLPAGPAPVSFGLLSVSFTPRRVGLVLTSTQRKRTIVEVARTREEKLEVAAKKLVRQLAVWLRDTTRYG
ncbi:hypothetical protein BJ138DRAFT_1149253 [Hygrophoropsis aurantiaca]|uniref:Uncharacterized protein n=1 Tax=Hygrophoropsis aurantiaca TaxID=72124 RepID=A0ACB8AFR9_9AGAM|nr:hypothetical protein BJ138DRAFT_1149253 [Hygrophoropsis aurantiaca]